MSLRSVEHAQRLSSTFRACSFRTHSRKERESEKKAPASIQLSGSKAGRRREGEELKKPKAARSRPFHSRFVSSRQLKPRERTELDTRPSLGPFALMISFGGHLTVLSQPPPSFPVVLPKDLGKRTWTSYFSIHRLFDFLHHGLRDQRKS